MQEQLMTETKVEVRETVTFIIFQLLYLRKCLPTFWTATWREYKKFKTKHWTCSFHLGLHTFVNKNFPYVIKQLKLPRASPSPSYFLSLSLWLYSPLDLLQFFNFLILYSVGRTPWTRDQPVARPLHKHRTAQTQNKPTQTSMPWVGFEPTIQRSGERRQFILWRAA
jgi:hypothetical protein